VNGESLKYHVRNVLEESSTSGFLDTRSTYQYIYEAARVFARRTKTLTATTSISTTANTTRYDLPTDFANLYFRNDRNEFVVKYTTSANSVEWLPFRQYDAMYESNNTTAVAVPDTFSINDEQSLKSRITGTASANGAASYEEAVLTDTSNSTQFANANIGDNVTNSNDSSNGIIIAKTSNTALVTVLFGGTANAWAANDAYTITPQSVKQLVIDPPPSASGDTVLVPYLQEPTPVFSSYRTYRIDDQYEMALAYYAAWLYKYRDRTPDQGDKWFAIFDDAIRKAVKEANKQLGRNTFRVNLRKRSYRDRSYR
jgi:hypothetical protein